jgi:hypothetical protein
MLRLSNGSIWEVQVRDYVENISLGLPNPRLLEQHSVRSLMLTNRRGRNHTFVLVDKIMYRMTISQYIRDRLILATRMPSRNYHLIGPT